VDEAVPTDGLEAEDVVKLSEAGVARLVVPWGGRKLCHAFAWAGSQPVSHRTVRAVPAFELAILRAIFHSKGPKA
jgi:hypothetical protein